MSDKVAKKFMISLLFLLNLGLINSINQKAYFFGNEEANLKTSSEFDYVTQVVTLEYNQSVAFVVDYEKFNNKTIGWGFNSSNPLVGITVRVMDNSNYSELLNYNPYNYTLLSNGNYTVDQGYFTLPYNDIWYFVYFNLDSDIQQTDLTIYIPTPAPADENLWLRIIEFLAYYSPWLLLIFLIVVAIIIIAYVIKSR